MGGFFKNPNAELMVRWYQFGAVSYPFFRNHAHMETARREPWTLPKSDLALVKAAVRTRYQILPYYYTLFHHYTKLGTPIIRPMWYEFPGDQTVYDPRCGETQLLVGGALLTAVVAEPNQVSAQTYLPAGLSRTVWYDWVTRERFEGGTWTDVDVRERSPIFAQGGKIIPTKFRQRRSSSLMHRDPFTLYIFLSSQKAATGRVYVDDYGSLDTASFEAKVGCISCTRSWSSCARKWQLRLRLPTENTDPHDHVLEDMKMSFKDIRE